ncbi:MAG: T9SS type A sorting domain-containing protein, partial [Candidatus Marinimicrobia bacterium]|nr:T9SS type A sorting domain-containing protein [Candidatus Neomarinimicrobiota bacterium]
RLSNDILDEDIIWSEDFESGAYNWLIGDGWELTQASYHSPNNSILSPNDNSNLDGYFMLFSPKISLPSIGLNEWLYFTFWLNADIPDYNGDNDELIDDYYQLDIQVPSDNSAWHISDFESFSDNSFWCGEDNIAGYQDGWIQFLDIPAIEIPEAGATLKVQMKWAIENMDGAAQSNVSEGWIDGWDAANVRISVDGGSTWDILIGNDPYDFYSGYGWVFNGKKAGEDGVYSLASGWSGDEDWHTVEFGLDSYAGKEVIIRFAFGSDPAYSTIDNEQLKGFFIDDIIIEDASGNNIALYDADNGNEILLNSSGYAWHDLFYDYYSEFCIDEDLTILENYPTQELCENNNHFWYSRPGSIGWEEYLPGDPFCDDCNYFLDLTDYSGKDVVFRFWSRYDNDHDGGQGDGLFIDDLTIYRESIQIYAQPQLFNADVGEDEIRLTWYDMNQSGDTTLIFDNGDEELFTGISLSDCSDCKAFAGTLFPAWLGETNVDSISIYNINLEPVDVTVNAYGLISNEPARSIDITLSEAGGWNTFEVDWGFSSIFLIANSFTDEIAAAFDPSTNMAGLWFLSNDVGSWEYVAINGEEIAGNWGTRAQVNYEGLNVTYNLYRDGTLIQTALTDGSYTDADFEYNTDYYYHLGVVYSDGIEIVTSDSIVITTPLPPIPEGVIEISHDDDSFESEFNAGGGNYSAVMFSSESVNQFLYMIKWNQSENGGAFYINIWEDDNGKPADTTIFSALQASGNEIGWNQKLLNSENISFSNNFWIGIKEFSSSQPIGLDTTLISEYSYQREGENGEWFPIEGNLAIRAYLSNEPLNIISSEIPFKYGIKDIFPNPFNPIANIQFEISEFSQVQLSIFDINGRLVKTLINDMMNPGQYNSKWNSSDDYGNQVSTGIYFAILESNNRLIQARKLVLLK